MNRLLVSSLAVSLGLCAPGAVAHATESMHLRSTAFNHDQPLPAELTCDGIGEAPPLDWSNPPAGTRSLAILVVDRDAPQGTFTHWLVTNITPAVHTLAAGGQLPPGARAGENSLGTAAYLAPCPASGTHHYVFQVYALDTILPARPLGRSAFLHQIAGHVLGYGKAEASYQRARRWERYGA